MVLFGQTLLSLPAEPKHADCKEKGQLRAAHFLPMGPSLPWAQRGARTVNPQTVGNKSTSKLSLCAATPPACRSPFPRVQFSTHLQPRVLPRTRVNRSIFYNSVNTSSGSDHSHAPRPLLQLALPLRFRDIISIGTLRL